MPEQKPMIIFPAIDMRNGKCVRLLQGQASQETVYFLDPVAVARQWEDEGAEWLHLVDLDGALGVESLNRGVAGKIFQALKIPVEFGGGIRQMEDLEQVIDAGASRVILGTAAVDNEKFLCAAVERYGEKVAVGVDARDGRVATKGWQQVGALDAVMFAKRLVELQVQRIIYTDISKDGMLQGPNLEATRQIAVESGLKVIASGGISSLEDIRRLKPLEACGVEGVIVGKALYEKRFKLSEALALAAKGD
jgi:phosphoribosylformimino-5-aminoimidazole carboxamide ribotide isomerase